MYLRLNIVLPPQKGGEVASVSSLPTDLLLTESAYCTAGSPSDSTPILCFCEAGASFDTDSELETLRTNLTD